MYTEKIIETSKNLEALRERYNNTVSNTKKFNRGYVTFKATNKLSELKTEFYQKSTGELMRSIFIKFEDDVWKYGYQNHTEDTGGVV